MFFLGIDPGVTGGWACISHDLRYVKFNGDSGFDAKYTSFCRQVGSLSQIKLATLEYVRSQPGEGVKSAFTFGRVFGQWEGVLKAFEVPYIEIAPLRWQKEVFDSVRKGFDTKTLSVAYAMKRFPMVKLTKKDHNIADAINLALYARNSYLATRQYAETS